jgi:hypothetical protein
MKKTIKKAFVARPSEWYKLTEGRKATIKKDFFYNGEGYYKGTWDDDGTKFECPSIFFDEIEEFNNEMILTSLGKNEKDKMIFTYQTKDKESKIVFQMHPTKAFSFIILEAINIPKNMINDILDGFILKGVRQTKFKGGFNEAIEIISF